MIKIIWSDDFPSKEMATLIRDKFDISVSYFMEDYDFGIRIANWDYNSKILNFIKKKVDDVSVIEESKKSMKESKHHKLIDYFDKAIPHYNIAIRDIDSDSELFFGEMNDLKNCSYRNFTVIECGINSPYYEDIDCLVFYIDLDEDVFVESKKSTKKSLKERNHNNNEIIIQFDSNGDYAGFDFESLTNLLNSYGYNTIDDLKKSGDKLNKIFKNFNILPNK